MITNQRMAEAIRYHDANAVWRLGDMPKVSRTHHRGSATKSRIFFTRGQITLPHPPIRYSDRLLPKRD